MAMAFGTNVTVLFITIFPRTAPSYCVVRCLSRTLWICCVWFLVWLRKTRQIIPSLQDWPNQSNSCSSRERVITDPRLCVFSRRTWKLSSISHRCLRYPWPAGGNLTVKLVHWRESSVINQTIIECVYRFQSDCAVFSYTEGLRLQGPGTIVKYQRLKTCCSHFNQRGSTSRH